MITQSGLKVTVGTLLLASALLGCVAYLVVQVSSRISPTLASRLRRSAPWCRSWSFAWRERSGCGKFEEQFPEAIDLLARALRAGHAFTTGLPMVADEMPDAGRQEFKLLYDQQNFGMPLRDAMKGFAERIPLLDARFFVTAVLTQRETGGNLVEVLDNLASVIRDRFKVKRQVRVLTAHGRITGWILAGLPPALAGVLCFIVARAHDDCWSPIRWAFR